MNRLKEIKLKNFVLTFLSLSLVILLALNSSVYFKRFDMTKSKMYTITDASKNIASQLKGKVTITYYISKAILNQPVMQSIIDILNEYALLGKNVVYKQIIIDKDYDESLLTSMGLLSARYELVEENKRSVEMVYSGLLIRYLDKEAVISFVQDDRTVEYELSSNIKNMITEVKKNIGVIIANEGQSMQDYSFLTEFFSKYSIQEVALNDNIPSDINVLLIIGSDAFDEYNYYPIDQFIMKGGAVMFAFDKVKINLENMQASLKENDILVKALDSYGIEMQNGLVLDKYSKSMPVPVQQGFSLMQDYPFWVYAINKEKKSSNSLIRNFNALDFYWASPLNLKEDSKWEPLIYSSEYSNLDTTYYINPQRSFDLEKGDSYLLAAAYNDNPLESYFKEIPKTEDDSKVKWTNYIPNSENARILLLSDSDIINPRLLVQTQQSEGFYNIEFIGNTIEWLAADEDILSIKIRKTDTAKLNKIADEDKKSAILNEAKFLNVIFMPIFIIILGFFRIFFKKYQRNYLNELQ